MIPSVYRDDRGWTYMVRGGIGLQDFKGFYNKPGKDGWIPVEELMPEKNKTVLVCQRRGAIEVAWRDGYRWKAGFSHAEWLCDVVAWRPMPEPYKAERSNDEKE